MLCDLNISGCFKISPIGLNHNDHLEDLAQSPGKIYIKHFTYSVARGQGILIENVARGQCILIENVARGQGILIENVARGQGVFIQIVARVQGAFMGSRVFR